MSASGPDCVVVGGGVSGVAFAHHAARGGLRPLILERSHRLGGCIHTARFDSGFWLELGAHTCHPFLGWLRPALDYPPMKA